MKYLKFFTFLTEDQVKALEAELAAAPEKRVAQRELAREVTRLVRGADAVAGRSARARSSSADSMADAKADEVLEVFADVPSTEIEARAVRGAGHCDCRGDGATGLAGSKGEAARLIRAAAST